MKTPHPIGADLVNHCVNDIAVQGATPLFFMDYLATGKLEPEVAEKVVEGLAEACKHNGCAQIGGETADQRASIVLTGLSQAFYDFFSDRSEEHTSELQSRPHLVCRLL